MAKFNFDVYRSAPVAQSLRREDDAHTGATTSAGAATSASAVAGIGQPLDGNALSHDSASPNATDKVYFTAEEAAAYMNLSLETFQILAADPELQPVRVMGTYHYRVAAVQRFMLKMELGDS